MRKRAFAAAAMAALLPGLAGADVKSSSPAGFDVSIDLPVAAPPAEVYAKFFEIGKWWSAGHTYSGKASNLSLKNEPGGCFCEVLPGGGFVRHATLEYAQPGRELRLQGALGPLQSLGVHGMLIVRFLAPGEKGIEGTRPPRFDDAKATQVGLSYIVSGYGVDKGFLPLAEPVNAVLKEQLERFKRFVETGKPEP